MKATQKSLRDWTNQNWRTSSGKPSLETGERYLPAAAWKSLSPAEKAATNRAKKKGMRAQESARKTSVCVRFAHAQISAATSKSCFILFSLLSLLPLFSPPSSV